MLNQESTSPEITGGTTKQLAITRNSSFNLVYINKGQETNPSIVGYNSSAYGYSDFYLSDKYGNKLQTQKETQMNIEELGRWEETWKEQLYARDYDSLPSFMEDALLEYFEDGGTAELFNKAYAYNEETADLVIDLYNEQKEQNEHIN